MCMTCCRKGEFLEIILINWFVFRPTSRQSEAYRNSPYPNVSSMGSDAGNHPHPHNYPPHSSHTLSGYDPHLLHHHHHHHHHPLSHSHPSDVYESHYASHEGAAGKRDSYVERQRQYFDEAVRGFQDPPHRSGYSNTQRPVQRFADPGSAKVWQGGKAQQPSEGALHSPTIPTPLSHRDCPAQYQSGGSGQTGGQLCGLLRLRVLMLDWWRTANLSVCSAVNLNILCATVKLN